MTNHMIRNLHISSSLIPTSYSQSKLSECDGAAIDSEQLLTQAIFRYTKISNCSIACQIQRKSYAEPLFSNTSQ